MNWLNRETGLNNEIGLHDCRAVRLSVSTDNVEFYFDSGFTLIPHTRFNDSEKPRETEASALLFDQPEIEISLFKEHRLFGRNLFTTRRIVSLPEFAEMLNSRKWELEFIHEYYGYHSALYACCVWQKRKPYHIDCQLDVYCKNIVYLWNK